MRNVEIPIWVVLVIGFYAIKIGAGVPEGPILGFPPIPGMPPMPPPIPHPIGTGSTFLSLCKKYINVKRG